MQFSEHNAAETSRSKALPQAGTDQAGAPNEALGIRHQSVGQSLTSARQRRHHDATSTNRQIRAKRDTANQAGALRARDHNLRALHERGATNSLELPASEPRA
jgi:hypothetical protein